MKAQLSFHDVKVDAGRKGHVGYVNKNGAIFSVFKHDKDLHTIFSRSTLKGGVYKKCI